MPQPSNTQLMMHSNSEFYVRIRPEEEENLQYYKVLDDQKGIYVRCHQDFAKGKDNTTPTYLFFRTSGVFYNVSQQFIFESVTGNGLFDKLIFGSNALIMCYGQTGSGKTLTAMGLQSTYEHRGLLPRILEKLFELKRQLVEKYKICIKLQYVETTRNYLVDLLDRETKVYDMNSYKNIKPTKVRDIEHGLKLIFKAEAHKTMRPKDNYCSNMANSIVTFMIYSKGHNTAMSCANLHVLAVSGIDTIGNSTCAHKTGYEVGNGNLAKSQIEQLIMVINESYSKSAELKRHLCIIIHYLRNVLNATSIIRVIGHIRTQKENLKITTSMMRLGCSIKGMVPKKLSRFLETSIDVQYQVVAEELKALKKEMDLNAMLCNEDMSCNLSDERLEYIHKLALDYLDGKTSELVLLSTTDTVLIMKIIKNVYKKLIEMNAELLGRVSSEPEQRSSKMGKIGETSQSSMASKGSKAQSAGITAKSSKKMGKSISASRTTYSKHESKAKLEAKSGANTRDNVSYHSLRSKTTSGKFSSKKRIRSLADNGKYEQDGVTPTLPEQIPSYTVAWNLYTNDNNSKYAELQYNMNVCETELQNLTKNYNKEVHALEDLKNIANLRRNELNHAIMIKDISTEPQTSEDLHQFQHHCTELSNFADKSLVDQKEKILKLQAEMRLHMEYRAKLVEERNKRFDEYCMQRFKVLIPEIDDDFKVDDIILDKIDYPYEQIDGLETQSALNENLMTIECMNNERFHRMKAYMKRELARVLRLKVHNQKWVLSFKLDK